MMGSPASKRSFASWLCLLSVLAMGALQWLWPGRLQSPFQSPGLAAALLMSLPLVLLAIGLWLERPQARFWSGVAALFYFCHGIAEAWAIPATWLPGMTEALLSVLVVLSSSWEGLRARLGARGRPTV